MNEEKARKKRALHKKMPSAGRVSEMAGYYGPAWPLWVRKVF